MSPVTSPSIHPVILSGGSGTRLWPASRVESPKQLLPMVESVSMLRATIDRVHAVEATMPPTVVCNVAYEEEVAAELEAAGLPPSVILEPTGRNTAPAAAAAALLAPPGSLLLVLPADHVITDVIAFAAAVATGRRLAIDGRLVTFGIVPSRPETGYGYIAVGTPLADGHAHEVARFVEKPDLATAEHYVADGGYLWNSGMFLFRADLYLDELTAHEPQIVADVQRGVDDATTDGYVIRLGDAFAEAPSVSIDYAVMERTTEAAVVPLDAGWSDVGSWSAIWEISPHDDAGNAVHGDVVAVDVTGSYLRSAARLVAVAGVHDLIVVETSDAVMVSARERAQDVRTLVERLRAAGRLEIEKPRDRRRRWGRVEILQRDDRLRVLHVVVNPSAALPPGRHEHRTEHWTVTRGVARISVGDVVRDVPAGESVSIPRGAPHQIENPGRAEITLICVETGARGGGEEIADEPDPGPARPGH